jgi:AcrR family transcriptional regulator
MAKGDSRNAQAWVDAGMRALVAGGIGAVRVEQLAIDLTVTKGSFYWHFDDRAALLTAMLTWWERVATRQVIEQVDAGRGDARERLRRLVAICTTGEGDRIESAVRAWGANDAAAKEVIARVDEERERFVAALFRELGLSAAQARHRARILYITLVGAFAWSAHGGEALSRETWRTLVNLLLSPSPA